MFEKNLRIGFLLDFYGDLLTERKRTVLDYYYNDDLSLAEIAENPAMNWSFTRKSLVWQSDFLSRERKPQGCYSFWRMRALMAKSKRLQRIWQLRLARN